MHGFEVMIPIVAISFSLAFAAFAVWTGGRTKQKRWEALASVQNRMLDKFGTAQEFVDFLKTPEGRSYMMVSVDQGTRQPEKILGSVRWGAVLAALGIGFLILGASYEDGLVVPGVLALSLGLGFLANSVIAVRLARSWGLMGRPHESDVSGIE